MVKRIDQAIQQIGIKKTAVCAGSIATGGLVASTALAIIGLLAILATQGLLPGAFSSLAALKMSGALVFTIAAPIVAIVSILFFLSVICKIKKVHLLNKQAKPFISIQRGSQSPEISEKKDRSNASSESKEEKTGKKDKSVGEYATRNLNEKSAKDIEQLIEQLSKEEQKSLQNFIVEFHVTLQEVTNHADKTIESNFFCICIVNSKRIIVSLKSKDDRNVLNFTNDKNVKGILLRFKEGDELFLPNWTQDDIISLIKNYLKQISPDFKTFHETNNGFYIEHMKD